MEKKSPIKVLTKEIIRPFVNNDVLVMCGYEPIVLDPSKFLNSYKGKQFNHLYIDLSVLNKEVNLENFLTSKLSH